MTKTSKIVDTVADAVTRAEIAIVRTGRKAVGAVNRKIGGKHKTARRKATRRKMTVKQAGKKAVTRSKRASRTRHTVRKAAKKARRSVRRS